MATAVHIAALHAAEEARRNPRDAAVSKDSSVRLIKTGSKKFTKKQRPAHKGEPWEKWAGTNTLMLHRGMPTMTLKELNARFPKSSRVLDELVMCRSTSALFKKRRLVLTKERVFFVCEVELRVLDSVPAHEIVKILRDHDNDDKDMLAFKIETSPTGFNSGTTFICRAQETTCKECIDALNRVSRARSAALTPSQLQVWQAKAANFGDRVNFQLAVAAMIFLNFGVICFEAQVKPEPGSKTAETLYDIDVAFTVFFTLELSVHLFAHLPFVFWTDGWNCFDFTIVALSWFQLLLSGILEVQQLRLFRMFRVARVLRVFGKLQQLRHIVNSILRAIVPMIDALLITMMVVFMYATIGVDSFSELAPNQFGDFFRAIYTLFATTSFEDWPEELHPFPPNGPVHYGIVFYVYSYVGIINYILLQVVVAVILESFFSDYTHKEELEDISPENVHESSDAPLRTPVNHKLEPLLEILSKYFNTMIDLRTRILGYYKVFDADQDGEVTFTELQAGLRKLPTEKPIVIDRDDYDELLTVLDDSNPNAKSGLIYEEFEMIMLAQLHAYIQRILSAMMQEENATAENITMIAAVKLMMLDCAPQSALAPSRSHTVSCAASSAPRMVKGEQGESHVGDLERAAVARRPSLRRPSVSSISSWEGEGPAMKTMIEANGEGRETDDRFDSGRSEELRTAPLQPENAEDQIRTLMRAIDRIEESIGVNFLEKIDLMLQPLRHDVGQIRSQLETFSRQHGLKTSPMPIEHSNATIMGPGAETMKMIHADMGFSFTDSNGNGSFQAVPTGVLRSPPRNSLSTYGQNLQGGSGK